MRKIPTLRRSRISRILLPKKDKRETFLRLTGIAGTSLCGHLPRSDCRHQRHKLLALKGLFRIDPLKEVEALGHSKPAGNGCDSVANSPCRRARGPPCRRRLRAQERRPDRCRGHRRDAGPYVTCMRAMPCTLRWLVKPA